MIETWVKNLSEKWARQIAENEETYEVIEYGLHQLFLILVNMLTVFVCGILWGELLFCFILYWIIFRLRPYAGGYHADTETACYFLSVGVINMAIVCRHMLNPPTFVLITLYGLASVVIWKCSPVENTTHPLEAAEKLTYSAKAKKLLIRFCAVWVLAMILHIRMISDGVFSGTFIIAISALAGKWKYKGESSLWDT